MVIHLNEGGPGSGNFGHSDVKGKRGGSAPGVGQTFDHDGGNYSTTLKPNGHIKVSQYDVASEGDFTGRSAGTRSLLNSGFLKPGDTGYTYWLQRHQAAAEISKGKK